MAEDQPCGGGGSAADHVLVRAADVRGDDLEDDAVFDLLLAGGIEEFGKIDGLDFDLAGLDVSDAAIGCHDRSSVQYSRQNPYRRVEREATDFAARGQILRRADKIDFRPIGRNG